MRITMQAHAKINWSLDILEKRADGYHELDMLLQRIALADVLHFERAKWLSLAVDGRVLRADGRNLILQAANALNDYTGKRHGARILLRKNIPMRAGLGGGSADCASALIALNQLWNLHLPLEKLCEIGLELGADVPYCVMGGFMRVGGIGQHLMPLSGARRYPLVIIVPGGGLSTPRVFEKYDRMESVLRKTEIEALARAIADGDFAAMRALSHNALEAPACALLPEIAEKIDALYALGASLAQMSGSGSCVYGVFDAEEKAARAAENLPGAVLTWTLP